MRKLPRQVDIDRVAMRDFDWLYAALFVDNLDDAPIGEPRHDNASQVPDRVRGVACGSQNTARLGEKFPGSLYRVIIPRAFPLGFHLRHWRQVIRRGQVQL